MTSFTDVSYNEKILGISDCGFFIRLEDFIQSYVLESHALLQVQ